MIKQYAKALMYIALAAVGFLVTALSDSALGLDEILNLVIVVLGAIGVYAIKNMPEGWRQYAKSIIAFVTAGVIALLSFLTGGVTITEWLQVILAAFAGIGVYITPNEPAEVTS